MTISRRELLRRAGMLGVTSVLPPLGCGDGASGDGTEGGDDTGGSSGADGTASGSTTGDDGLPHYQYDGDPGPDDLFQHGVASGDPLTDSVILWTRVTGAPEGTVDAFYEVALDPEFTMRVAAGDVQTGPERDYTIKLDLDGLAAGTTYYYRFYALGIVSPIGRTRTAADTAVDRMRIVVVSCASLAHGYFHAYRRIAARADLDFVVHLGDYIYEYGSGEYGDIRPYEPEHECLSLADYRQRYAQYRRDPDLQECHRQHPMIAVWDDHEIADNAWSDGAVNHMPTTEGSFAERKAAAEQAYAEWIPYREGMAGILYRTLAFGELVQLILLDTRNAARDQQLPSITDPSYDDDARQLLGATQEAWLAEQLAEPATWRLVGQQVMMAQLHVGENPINLDQWDGYPAARERFFAMVREHAPTNLAVLTGDIHSSWAFDLAEDPFGPDYDAATGEGSLAVEFVVPSITSPGFPSDTASVFMQSNPHLRWGNLVDHGYVVVDVTRARVQASWWLVDDITDPDAGKERFAAAWSLADGTSHLVEDAEAAEPIADAPAPAP